MAGMIPLPQTVTHGSQHVSHREAYDLLSSFLQEADTNPAYRPDSVLTQHGITAAGVGSESNLTLNHLNRILRGIAGERVGGVDFNYGQGPPKKRRRVEDQKELNSNGTVVQGSQKEGAEVVEGEDEDGAGQAAVVGQESGDWQDKEDFEHAQVDETQDLAERNPADTGTVDGTVEPMEIESTTGALSKADKLARKQAKQARRKQEKKDRNTKTKD